MHAEITVPESTITAERALTASLILAPERVADVAAVITADDFLDDSCRNIFQAVLDLHGEGRAVDTVTLASLLSDRQQFDDMGGHAGMGEIMMTAATSSNAGHYAALILEQSRRRKMTGLFNRLRNDLASGTVSVDIAGQAQAELERLFSTGASCQTLSLADVTRTVTEGNEVYEELPTGWRNIDTAMCGGLPQSSLTVVAGAPSVGKSQFGIHLAHNVAKAGTGVLYIVQEMGCEEVYDRLCAIETAFASNRIRRYRRALAKGDPDSRIPPDYIEALGRLKDLPIHIHAHGAITPAEYSALICRHHKKIGLVVLDYLQQVNRSHPKQTDLERVNEISALCKSLAARYRLPSVALAQFNRDGYKDGGKPTMAHIRASGLIEADADNILLLWRERRKDAKREDLEINIAKQRSGPTKSVILDYSLPSGKMLSTGAGDDNEQ